MLIFCASGYIIMQGPSLITLLCNISVQGSLRNQITPVHLQWSQQHLFVCDSSSHSIKLLNTELLSYSETKSNIWAHFHVIHWCFSSRWLVQFTEALGSIHPVHRHNSKVTVCFHVENCVLLCFTGRVQTLRALKLVSDLVYNSLEIMPTESNPCVSFSKLLLCRKNKTSNFCSCNKKF